MPLTPQEKVLIRHHLGFLNVAEAYTFVLGTPAGVETQFVIEGAMNRILEDAMPLVRNLLSQCELIAASLTDEDMIDITLVNELGEIKTNRMSFRERREMYDWRRQELANAFGVYANPFDKRAWGGVNVPVRH